MSKKNLEKVNLQLFAMKNLDTLQQQKAEIANKMNQAMKDNDEKAFADAFEEYTNILQEAVLSEAKGLVQASDNQILAGRGVRVLTSEEKQYYEKLIEAMKSDNPKQSLSGFGDILPKTVIDAVFEDITEEHPLLEAINFKNAEALTEYLYSTMDGRFKAIWGKLCSEITKQISSQFSKISFGQNKLSAFIPVCKAMLDLGPTWLDRYVRTILYEAIANGLEDGAINGRGVATGAADPDDHIYEPIGMIKDLTNFNVATGYGNKTAIPVTDFSPESYGVLIAQLAVGPNNLNRTVTEVLLIVNPVDYLTKVFPATTYLTPQGGYVKDIFPFPTKVVQSAYIQQGKAILGIAKRYFAVIGTGKDGRIEYSDEYRFLEDERTYLIKLYGTGRPLDNNSFLLLDISNLKATGTPVKVTNFEDFAADATLESLTIGSLTLTPTFDPDKYVYSVSTSNASNTITATPSDADGAAVTITVNGAAHENGAAASWSDGANNVVITVTNGASVLNYVVIVTKT